MRRIFPSIIFIENNKKTHAFINELLMYNCTFRQFDIEVKSINPVKPTNFTIDYHMIKNVTLSLCSRLGPNFVSRITMIPGLSYHIDIIINTTDCNSYIFEIQPTSNLQDIIEFLNKLEISINDKFSILPLLSNPDFLDVFKKKMASNFKNLAKDYNLDNPRKDY